MRRTRQIITIDEDKCDGCGQCVAACHEGALALEGGKARLVSEVYCDGLGACIGECPQGAITIETREAEDFDAHVAAKHAAPPHSAAPPAPAHSVPQQAVPQSGRPVPHAGCPGSALRSFTPRPVAAAAPSGDAPSQLANWPVQLHLAPPIAPHYHGAHLLLAADCVPFAMADFHARLLQGRTLLVGCPKLDDTQAYRDKLAYILAANEIAAIDVAYMQVPCCGGLVKLLLEALAESGREIPVTLIKVGLQGEELERRKLAPQPVEL